MGKILQLNNVSKNFGGIVAADNVSMDLEAGEIHGLIGPNGAGKTTLLNLISGILDVDSGTINFIGRDITKIPSYKRSHMGLSRTFQVPRFLERSDIEENLLIATDLAMHMSFLKSFFGKKDKNFIKELNELTEMVGFSYNLEDDISSLTFGQKKLLEIIRAMLTRPKAMMVDEPAAGLNQKELENAVLLLKTAAFERGIGIILIEHKMDMVMSVCHNITVLNFGKVIACGIPAEVSSNENVIIAYLGRKNVKH